MLVESSSQDGRTWCTSGLLWPSTTRISATYIVAVVEKSRVGSGMMMILT